MVQSNSIQDFNVRKCEPELVCPSRPTPNEIKLLSHVDQMEILRHRQVPVIGIYRNVPNMKDKDPAKVIKNALAEALVYYYPMAGRFIERQNQKLAVDCTSEGVMFVEAEADISLDELMVQSLLPPFPYLDKFLHSNTMEAVRCPLLTIQITRLSCQGLIFVFRFHHALCDGTGAIQFISTVFEFAKGALTPSIIPVWQRDLLTSRKRDPPPATPKNNVRVAPIASLPDNYMVHLATFYPSDISALRANVSPHIQRRCTSFELITAALWRCRTIALQFDPQDQVRMAFTVDSRFKFSPRIPAGYYGNAFTVAIAVSTAGEISNGTLSYVVEQVKKGKSRTREEYKRSLIDPGIFRTNHLPIEAQTYFISETTQIEVTSDFGWGEAIYAGPADNTVFPQIGSFIFLSKDENGKDLKVAPISLPADAMDRFTAALDDLLKQK